jgi:dethiobiotin synthase
MLRGIFVTGTDTGIGKTVTCAALLHRVQRERPVRYWKPIQTGIEEDDDTATVRRLSGCRADQVLDEGVRLPRPLSPHLAARLRGVTIDVETLAATAEGQPASDVWIVEGAGGVLVPIDERTLMVDFMRRLALPVLVVARSALGTINHTLLTVEALRTRALVVAGVVMVGRPNADNREAIEHYGGVSVLAELDLLDSLTPQSLQQAALALDQARFAQMFP